MAQTLAVAFAFAGVATLGRYLYVFFLSGFRTEVLLNGDWTFFFISLLITVLASPLWFALRKSRLRVLWVGASLAAVMTLIWYPVFVYRTIDHINPFTMSGAMFNLHQALGWLFSGSLGALAAEAVSNIIDGRYMHQRQPQTRRR